jgi:hypothetical protein
MHPNLIFGAIALGLAAFLLIACEAGFWVGARAGARAIPKAFDNAMNWQAAVLGLAALLIGFTFAMAVSRFDTRKQVLIAEANAIENAYHRTYLLDDDTGDTVRELMRRYVDMRIVLFDASVNRKRAESLERAGAELQAEIWLRLVEVGRANPQSEMMSLVLQATTDMFERGAERRDNREMPVPPTVFLIVVLVSAIAVASIGYTLGLAGARMSFGMLVIPLLVAGVIMLVVDIAHPSLGIIRVPDTPMLHLRRIL